MRSHKGQFLVEHDGMTDGFYTLVSFMPRHQMGVIALSNCDAYYNPVQSNRVPELLPYTARSPAWPENDCWNKIMIQFTKNKMAIASFRLATFRCNR
jgi:hypothetical protein